MASPGRPNRALARGRQSEWFPAHRNIRQHRQGVDPLSAGLGHGPSGLSHQHPLRGAGAAGLGCRSLSSYPALRKAVVVLRWAHFRLVNSCKPRPSPQNHASPSKVTLECAITAGCVTICRDFREESFTNKRDEARKEGQRTVPNPRKCAKTSSGSGASSTQVYCHSVQDPLRPLACPEIAGS